jgi:uncharacterized protein (DUF2147 family)
MLRRYIRVIFLFLAFNVSSKVATFAQADPIANSLWYNEDKTAKIQLSKGPDNKYYGKIAWLKVPEKNGKPKMDEKNPDKLKRTMPLLGLQILRELKKTGDNTFDDGTIYDPKNGKTYSCKMTYKGDRLDLRGYIGFSVIGRTTTWTKAEP